LSWFLPRCARGWRLGIIILLLRSAYAGDASDAAAEGLTD